MSKIPSYTRIGLCADTHNWPNGRNNILPTGEMQLQRFSDELQHTLLSELERADLDLVLHLGDLTCGGGSFDMPLDQFLHSLHDTHAAFNSLSMPVHALPGNHDCLPGGSDWSLFEELWQLESGMGQTIDTPHARLFLLNAQGHSAEQIEQARPADVVYGWVNEAELARLDQALATANGLPVIIFVHQLLKPWSGPRVWKEFYAVKNAHQVLDLMQKYPNVSAVFQGHAHMLDVQTVWQNGSPTTFVVSPSLVEYPISWLLLTIGPDSLTVEMKALPLPHLRDQSLHSGSGQAWRSGTPSWRNFTIPLAETCRVC